MMTLGEVLTAGVLVQGDIRAALAHLGTISSADCDAEVADARRLVDDHYGGVWDAPDIVGRSLELAGALLELDPDVRRVVSLRSLGETIDAYGRPREIVHCESPEAASHWDARDWPPVS